MKIYKLIGLFVFTAISSFAQDIKDLPNISYVYPAGIQRGTTANIIIAGSNFENVKEIVGSAKFENVKDIVISGEGVKATLVNTIIPSSRSRAVGLINELQKTLIQRGLLDESSVNDKKSQVNLDFRAYPDLQEKRFEILKEQRLFRLMKSTQASHSESLEVELIVDKNAKIGKRTLKVITNSGVSNSVVFYIGDLPEYAEYSIREKNLAIIRGAEGSIAAEVIAQDPSLLIEREQKLIQEVSVPLTINGQIDLFESDTYKFYAREGQSFAVQVQVRDLIPFISDAVPGWFQATISIKDSSGKEIAYQDDFFQNADPLLIFEIPKDDFYTLEIQDAIFRGREDFVYRITLSAFPFITRIYPLGGSSGQQEINLIGSNLRRQSAVIKPHSGLNELDVYRNFERQGTLLFNADNLESIEVSNINNFSPEKAQELNISQAANSILKNKGDKHFYKIKLEEDKDIVVEIFARRLGSPLDSHIELLDSNLNHIHSNDDIENQSDALITHHADSRIDFHAKANTIYYISLRDTQNNAGEEYAYRLCVSELKADFDIKTSPSTINILEGKSAKFDISVFRERGFSFPIKVELKNAPKGLSLSGGYIAEDTKNISMVLSSDKSLKSGLYDIQLEASAYINAKEIKKILRPCEDMTQAFYYKHLVDTHTHQVYILPMDALHKYQIAYRIKQNENLAKLIPDALDIPCGGEAKLYIGAYSLPFSSEYFALEAELQDSDQGISISKIENTKDGSFITLKSDSKISKIGQSSNLIIDIYTRKKNEVNSKLPTVRDGKNSDRIKIDTLKAIRYNISKAK